MFSFFIGVPFEMSFETENFMFPLDHSKNLYMDFLYLIYSTLLMALLVNRHPAHKNLVFHSFSGRIGCFIEVCNLSLKSLMDSPMSR